MTIRLSKAGKRFNREWIFRSADLEFHSGNSYAITGPNGSGKSTLLQCIGGMLQLSEGQIEFSSDLKGNDRKPDSSQPISNEKAYRHISFCAPYFDVIEEMTLKEFLEFHQRFKPYLPEINRDKIIDILGLKKAENKQIRYYSSGMKQRVKLAQAILYDTEIVLLDEPCTNLDLNGIELYHSLIQTYCRQRLVLVCSNDEIEYNFCKEKIDITSYK